VELLEGLGVSEPLIGGSQKLEERPVTIRQAVVIEHH
jgi:hypothetical protein